MNEHPFRRPLAPNWTLNAPLPGIGATHWVRWRWFSSSRAPQRDDGQVLASVEVVEGVLVHRVRMRENQPIDGNRNSHVTDGCSALKHRHGRLAHLTTRARVSERAELMDCSGSGTEN